MILKKYLRGQIEEALLKRTFADRIGSLIADRSHLAVALYQDFYPPTIVKAMRALPEGWLRTDNNISFYIGDSHHNIGYNGAINWSYNNGCKIFDRPAQIELPRVQDHGSKVYDPKTQFAKTYADLKVEKDKIEHDFISMRSAIRAQTYAFTTVEKLLAHWPEIAPIVSSITTTVELPATLPVPSVAPLNKALGL